MCKSPAGAPSRPPSPLPGIRTREPVSTPAGMRTFTVSVFGNVPLPLHSEQGERRRPVPPQSGHSCAKRKRPPARCTWPVPLHVEQTTTGPPMSPAPLQREHCSERLTVMFVVKSFDRFFERKRQRHFDVGASFWLRSWWFLFFSSAAAKEIREDVAETTAAATAAGQSSHCPSQIR